MGISQNGLSAVTSNPQNPIDLTKIYSSHMSHVQCKPIILGRVGGMCLLLIVTKGLRPKDNMMSTITTAIGKDVTNPSLTYIATA